MLNGGGGPTSALILGERLECESLISWAPKDLHRREPYKWQKNLPQVCDALVGCRAADRETQAPPGHQASLDLALTALLMRQTNQKTTKQTFTNLLPPKSNAIVWLCWEIAGPSTIFLILTSNAEGNLLLSLWGGTSRDGFFLQHLMQHQQSSALTERAVHFLN